MQVIATVKSCQLVAILLFARDPLARPSQDWYDLDPWDGKVTAVCQENGVSGFYGIIQSSAFYIDLNQFSVTGI